MAAKKKKKPVKSEPQKAVKKPDDFSVRIKVIGIGGAGCNAISRMAKSFPKGIELIAMNTDIQDLRHANAKKKIQVGKNITRGLGTGMNPEMGRQAAEESRAEISDVLSGADLVFIAAGFGGGTGSGASPVVAEIAKDMGVLTIAVVTKPFGFEGSKRTQIAEEAILKLRDSVDTLITVPNDRIFSLISKDTSLAKAFEEIDEVLKNSVFGITELINSPGFINVDFADVKTIVKNGGPAIMGIGIASGGDRSVSAANAALHSPLLELSIEGAKGIIFSISGHRDLKMNEINDVAKLISESADPSARIIFGTYYDRKLRKGQMKVMVIATGFNDYISKGNALFPGLFSANNSKKPPEAILPEKKNQESAEQNSLGLGFDLETEKRRVEKIKEIPFFDKRSAQADKINQESQEEVWDIPAFLRRKKKKWR
ncbi:MAG: cell division protein FtsZ [Candidatus Wolfebacteria bacterium]|nr:cell division protein FtsZ [Candidatus Wolfebacteria bacterium]